MKPIILSNSEVISQLSLAIKQLSAEEYAKQLEILNGSSVGMHVRHILEFYTCLLNTYNSKNVSYDKRKRQLIFEVDPSSTIEEFGNIHLKLEAIEADLPLTMYSNTDTEPNLNSTIQTTLSRELLYTLDHTIHHMALIKIAIAVNFPKVVLNDNFGVAPSTIRFRESQCAQ